jgi:hypothetical protein
VKAGMMTVFSDVISFAPNSSLTVRDYAFEKNDFAATEPTNHMGSIEKTKIDEYMCNMRKKYT